MNEHTNQTGAKHPEQEQSYVEEQASRKEASAVDQADNQAVEHHHHYYYYGQSSRAKEAEPRRWYNQGWMWLIVAVVGIGTLLVGLVALTGQLGGVGEAVREQTGAVREQTGVLTSINQSLEEMSAGLSRSMQEMSAGIERVERAIRDGINTLLSAFQ